MSLSFTQQQAERAPPSDQREILFLIIYTLKAIYKHDSQNPGTERELGKSMKRKWENLPQSF